MYQVERIDKKNNVSARKNREKTMYQLGLIEKASKKQNWTKSDHFCSVKKIN